jgi:MFS family permease
MVMCYLGGSVGQQLLNLVDVQKQTLFLIVGLLMTACVIPVSLTRTIHPKIAQIKPMGLKRIFKQAPMGLLGCFTSGLLTSSFYTMGPVFCTQLHLSVTHLSYFMTFTVLGGLLFQWPVGAITDRFDRSQVLPVLSCALAVFCGLMILTIQSSLTVLLAGSIVFGGLMFTIYPTAVARAHDMFEPHNVVTVSSALLLFYGVGAVTGPVVSSAAIEFFPRPYGLFIYFSGIGLLYALVSFLLRLKEIALVIPVEEQVDFIIMNHTSQVAIQIDPRTQTDQTVP